MVVVTFQLSLAQNGITLELGHAGEIVANAWNPLRLTMRDLPAAVLVLEIDQGSLRGGEEWVRYQADLPGGSGISVFEDDVYVPAWRSFSWRVHTGTSVLASGSFDRRAVDPRPLQLVASAEPGRWRGLFDPEARVLDVASGLLPERAAAYDGVSILIMDGTQPPPRAAAVAAATSSGVTTILVGALPPSYESIELLAPQARQRLGAGWLLRASERNAWRVLERATPLDTAEMASALLTPDLTEPPETRPFRVVLMGSAAYLLTVFGLVYFGRVPGLLTALALVALAGLAAWNYLRPAGDVLVRGRSLSLSSGGLAYTQGVRTLFSRPASDQTLRFAARPLDTGSYVQGPDRLELSLPRWSSERLMLQPFLGPSVLVWQDQRLVNTGRMPLTDVLVVGFGPQHGLDPGESLSPRPMDYGDGDILPVYRPLQRLLPDGSALAHQGAAILVALPDGGEAPVTRLGVLDEGWPTGNAWTVGQR